MTLADAEDFLGMWEEEPPIFVLMARIEAMLAAWFGVRRGPAAPGELPRTPDAEAQMAFALTQALGAPNPTAFRDEEGMTFDFEELKRRARGG